MILTYREAIREGMSIRMREDPRVILFGEDTGAYGGSFGITLGMYDEFGGDRVRDTPISESAIIGCAVGSAATGMRPIAELVFCDFLMSAAGWLRIRSFTFIPHLPLEKCAIIAHFF